MNRSSLCWLAVWVFTLSQLPALEINTKTGLMLFDSGIQTFPDTTEELGIELDFIGSVNIRQQYSEFMTLDISIEHDPILLNRMLSRLGIHTSSFSLQAGPFLGLFNGSDIVNPGISVVAAGNFASFIYGSFEFDSTLKGGINEPGDYAMNKMEGAIGFDLPIGIALGFGMDKKSHSKKQGNGGSIKVERTRYYISVEGKEELWDKIKMKGSVGYQELGWGGILGGWKIGYQHESVYGGLEMSFKVLPYLDVYIGGEASVYSWARQEVQESAPEGMIFCEFNLGTTWKFDPVKRK